ncbi:MAG TPA: xanthine dehydrogenase family protein molybdopterin-binding subunit [Solirubrobacteraceae bacterium]|nr:xanthine dehydrogenase family protein molybdopterin-binding subunit [Solirubrobacteraceae bacterium]
MSTPRSETTFYPAIEQSERLGNWSGKNVPRKEDKRLLKGQGAFVDDLWMHRQGHVHFVRSPYAHARITAIDVARCEAVPGVYATLTGEEVGELQQPYFQMAPEPAGAMKDYCMAVGKARYMGEPVAAVLAESAELARDAAELIEVSYEPLPVVVDGIATIEPDAPVLHEEIGSNVGWHGTYDYGDIDWAIENADHVVRIDRLHFHRFSSTPLETSGALVNWDPGTGVVEFRTNNQMPMFAAMFIGPAIGLGIDHMQFSSQDIGGGFGIKITSYTYLTALALLSRKAGRPVKWSESRWEHLAASAHGNERTFLDIEVPVMNDGTILGFKVRAFDDAGAYLRYEPLGAVIWAQVVPGNYRFKHVRVDYTESLTNKCPVGPNRGYSRLQHLWMIERLVDIVANELGFDRVALRKLNYVQPEEFPYETPNGCIYDSGDYPAMLDRALELIDYEGALARQRASARSGRRIGIGIGSTLDSGTNNFGQSRIINSALPFSGNGEAAIVRLDLYGEVTVTIGTSPQGQGHETTAAQVTADILGMSPDQVHVAAGYNKAANTYVGFSGTYASQFAVTGLGAVMGAAEKLRGEIIKVGACMLGSEESDIELADGFVRLAANPEAAIPFIGIAATVFANVAELPGELADSVTLNCRYVYRPPFEVPDHETKTGKLTLTYASQVHAAVVEVDDETGQVTILDYAAVDECGRKVNPMIVEGQVHGATGHGVGAALYESFEYDADGQLLNSTFADYHAATSLDVPHIRTGDIECPSPFTPNGAKGMGEGGGAPLSTIASAIEDALPDGAHIVFDTHNNSERVFELLRSAAAAGPRGVEVISR